MSELLKSSVSSKQSGFERLLCPLIAEACINVCPKNPHNFNVDNVRVCKLVGGSVYDSVFVKGMVFKRESEGIVKKMEDAKVAVYAQGRIRRAYHDQMAFRGGYKHNGNQRNSFNQKRRGIRILFSF